MTNSEDISPDSAPSSAEREVRVLAETEPTGDAATGPHAWLNWQAERDGLPARTSSRTHDILVLALWHEYGFFSDAHFVGDLAFGPYRLLLGFSPRWPKLGEADLQLVLRAHDHLLDPDSDMPDIEEQHLDGYSGGDLGEQVASLLALALARRVRSAGVMRQGYENEPEGKPFFGWYRPPALIAPWQGAVLPGVAEEARLEDATAYLDAYAELDGPAALAIQRAAHQYADALWWADADPRIAWIKLFGAAETAADHWDADGDADPVAQLKRRHPVLYGKLKRKSKDALPIVAKSLSRVLGAESKMIDFLLAYRPEPPDVRPEFGRLDWDALEDPLNVLYNHRSRDLHGGIPFPAPLSRPPERDNAGVPAEAFSALAAADAGGSWPAAQLPMYLHTFAYLVGGALRRWWLGLPTVAPSQKGANQEEQPAASGAEPTGPN